MKKKFLFSSLFVAAAMVGCTNEDFVGQGQNDGLGVDRQVINVSFGVEEPQTKMVGEGDFIYYTTDDKIGAVLVDHTQKEPYTIVDTHVGNNKFNYIANKKLTKDTLKGYKSQLKYNILPYFGEIQINKITYEMIVDFMQKMKKRYKPKTASNGVTLLGSILKYAFELGLIKHNPYYGVKNSMCR